MLPLELASLPACKRPCRAQRTASRLPRCSGAGVVHRKAIRLLLLIWVGWLGLGEAVGSCNIHDQCGTEWFCGGMPFSAGGPGSCEPCWKCCLFPGRFNFSIAANAAGAPLRGGCTLRCGCNTGRTCSRDSDCAAGLFCGDGEPQRPPLCKPCTECEEAGCSPKCPGGPVSELLGPPQLNAASYDPALRDAAVFLSLALEPWRRPDADRTQVHPDELRALLLNETQLLEPFNSTVVSYSEMFVANALAQVFGPAPQPDAAAAPLKRVAELLLHGSRALLCPALFDTANDNKTNTMSGAPVAVAATVVVAAAAAALLPRRTGPGCPCNLSADAPYFRCPPGHSCSRGAHLGLSLDVLADPTWATLGGVCVPCTAGQLCLEGSNVLANTFGIPDCPAGYFCRDPGEVVRCPAGFFCPPRTPAPITCSYARLLESSTPSTRRQEGGLDVFRRLWRERAPIRGNFCPAGSMRPDVPCGGGRYCPDPSVQLLCPQGHYCKPQSVQPVKCPPLVKCPAGSSAPDGRALAGIILAVEVVAVLILYGSMQLGKFLALRFIHGWKLTEPPDASAAAAAAPAMRSADTGNGNGGDAHDLTGTQVLDSSYHSVTGQVPIIQIEMGPSPRATPPNAAAGPSSALAAAAGTRRTGQGFAAGSPGSNFFTTSPKSFFGGGPNTFFAASPHSFSAAGPSPFAVVRPGSSFVVSPFNPFSRSMPRFDMDRPAGGRGGGGSCPFRESGVGDEWDDAVLLEPNDNAAVRGKVLQGRYYSFKSQQTINIRFSNVRRDGRLQDVDGAFNSGQLNVVMGPSGCGKSTLIELLSGRLPGHELDAFQLTPGQSGILESSGGGFGGAQRQDIVRQRRRICLSGTAFRSLLGFVPQEDILHADLTVRENLAFSARLKLPRAVSRNDVDAIIDETLDMLDMEPLRHSRTGSVERRSLSGGQRKRVSIGVEIVGKRPVMFMDEPTSGLDATTSYELCVLLSQIAKTFGINIIAVIHQPSYRCFRLFDCLLLLGRHGEPTFHGRPRDCVSHFRRLGHRVVLKDCAETILDIAYKHKPSPRLDTAALQPSARGKIELIVRPAGADAKESDEAQQTAESVYCVSWSPDGRSIAVGTGDGTLHMCDANSAGCIARLKGHSKCVRCVAWRPWGFKTSQLVSGGDDTSVRLWNWACGVAPQASNNNHCAAVLEAHTRVVTCVAWSPDGRFMASAGSWDKTVRLWDPASSHSVACLVHRHAVSTVAWSPDGRLLASGSNDGAVWLWETERCKSTATLKGHRDWVRTVSWCRNSRNLASGSSDGTLRLWDVTTGECLAILEGHESYINSVAWSPIDSLVASGGGDRNVRLWDAATGACVSVLEGHNGSVTGVAWSPDGGALASGSSDGTLRVWNLASGSATLCYAVQASSSGAAGAAASGLKAWLQGLTQGAEEGQTPFPVQLRCLIQRNILKSSRVSLGAILLDVIYLQIAALIVGCIQGSNWAPSKAPSNFVMAFLVLSMLSAVTHLRTFSTSRMVQLYERMSGVSVSATFLSSNITDLGWIFLTPAVYFSIYYFINMPHATFLDFYEIGLLVCWWSSGLSYVISTSVMPYQHHTTVAVIGTLIMGAFLHGLSPSIASTRRTVMEAVLGVSYSRWAMEAITIQEFRSGDYYAWNEAVAIQGSLGICSLDRLLPDFSGSEVVTEDDAVDFLELWRTFDARFCDRPYIRAMMVLFCAGLGMRLVAWLQIKYLKLWILEVTEFLADLRKAVERWRRARVKCAACKDKGGSGASVEPPQTDIESPAGEGAVLSSVTMFPGAILAPTPSLAPAPSLAQVPSLNPASSLGPAPSLAPASSLGPAPILCPAQSLGAASSVGSRAGPSTSAAAGAGPSSNQSVDPGPVAPAASEVHTAAAAADFELAPHGSQRPPINLAGGALTITLVAACSTALC